MVKVRYILIILFSFFFIKENYSQRTIGLLKYGENTYEGYTLFAPISSKVTYLIDNCGYIVNEWISNHLPGQTAYLLPSGELLRTARIPGSFTGGGLGGKIEIFSWEGILKWSKEFASDNFHQHHVAHPMPNGNILTILWQKYEKEEAIQKGFIPEKLSDQGIWSDKIIEFKILPDNQMEIVWEWDFWDHTIQDIDVSKDNWGVVSDHPELLDVNFFEDPGANLSEWLHANSIDYNEKLDQIIISSKYHNEFYIIDHSTTTQEAKGHIGGKYGKGGDFLYRWGNPRSYKRGTINDHWLFGQHDVQWIHTYMYGNGNILLFNNGSNRTGSLYSSVEEIVTPVNEHGEYHTEPEKAFQPEIPTWIYTGNPVSEFYSSRISGAQRLPNGNTLICEGNKGNFIEVDIAGKIVWQYKNPVNNFGPGVQGSNLINNDVFKATRYSPDYKAFAEKILSGSTTIESNVTNYSCLQLVSTPELVSEKVIFYPNPAKDYIIFRSDNNDIYEFQIADLKGTKVNSGLIKDNEKVDLSKLNTGMYFIELKRVDSKNKIIYGLNKF